MYMVSSKDLRVKMYEDALRLHKSGIRCLRIVKTLKEKYGVAPGYATVWRWVHAIRKPAYEYHGKPNLSLTSKLALLAAASVSDATISKTKNSICFEVEMKDLEPVSLISQCLSEVLSRPTPYPIYRRVRKKFHTIYNIYVTEIFYVTKAESKELCLFLRDKENIYKLLDIYPDSFIKMFFECEGGVSVSLSKQPLEFYARIFAANTNLQLLRKIVKKLMEMGINSRIILVNHAGYVNNSPYGRIILTKNCYQITIEQKKSIKEYFKKISFISKRKVEKLRDVIEILENYNYHERALEWIRRYSYMKHGREKWIKRIQMISVEEAMSELERYVQQKQQKSRRGPQTH
ncbi:MAG: LAGLIDADG family homing endonuclease [Nitrososphaerota archaeon]